MRKIKFRAWNKQTGKMIYSDQVYPRSMYKFEFDKFRAWNKQTGKMIYSDQVYPRSMYKFEFDLFNDFDFKLMKMVDRYNVTDDEGNDT